MRLAASSSLTTLALLIAGPALAQTRTSTAGDVTNAGGATLTPTAGNAAIIIDSNNAVTNGGTISSVDIDNATGVATSGTRTGSITNTGSISINDSYTATDTNGDGIVDPPFATGTGRYGIRIGSGTFTGAITSSGTLFVEGNNSAALQADGTVIGNITSSGAITVTGDNSYGVRLGPVTGNVAIVGGVAVTGTGSEAISLTGPVTGQVVVRGIVSTNGYSVTALPTTLTSLTSGNTNQGGPAVRIGGSVTGGVQIGATPTTTDSTDADNDGIADSSEVAGTITAYGSAPAVLIGGASPITIGTFGSTGAGFVNGGSITGNGIYAGFNATALQIGGQGGTVAIAGGLSNSGTIFAIANTAQATAIGIASGASTPLFTNTGTISATGTTASGASARGIAIDAGGSLPSISNSGTISASVGFTGGRATAILDASGTLATITSTGTITASDASSTARAIDVSANTTGFTYTQNQSTSTTTLPALNGAIVTGSGAANLVITAGTVKSAVTFGGSGTIALSGSSTFAGSTVFGGSSGSLTLAGSSTYTGSADFGSRAGTLAITGTGAFSGTIANGGATALSVTGGTATFTATGATPLGSLSLSGGTLGITIDPTSGTASQLVVAGATTIGSGSTLKVNVGKLALATQNYTVIRSGTLSGSGNLSLSLPALPYLLTGSLNASDAAGTVNLTIARKTAAALGFNRAEASAYDAVYAAIVGNTSLNTLFTSLTDGASTISRYRQMLPDHDGGLFDLVTRGVQTLNPGEGAVTLAKTAGLSIWGQQAYWGTTQKTADAEGYHGTGFGLTGGADMDTGIGRVGLSIGYIYGSAKTTTHNSAQINQFQGGAHWIANWKGLRLTAYGVGGIDRLSSTRSIDGANATAPILLTSKGDWNGVYYGGGGKLAYEIRAGAFYLRPTGGASYSRLHEDKHDDREGGAGFDLSVAARTSDEVAATGTLVVGAQFGGSPDDPEVATWRFELEGGRRQVIGGTVGATTAHFAGGQDFTLTADQRTSGYTGSASASVGNDSFRFVATAVADTRDGYHSVAGRVGVRGFF